MSARALGFSSYDSTWQLACELGSNMRFGVTFPIRHQQGQPFDVSLDDVQFEVPDVDPGAVIQQYANETL